MINLENITQEFKETLETINNAHQTIYGERFKTSVSVSGGKLLWGTYAVESIGNIVSYVGASTDKKLVDVYGTKDLFFKSVFYFLSSVCQVERNISKTKDKNLSLRIISDTIAHSITGVSDASKNLKINNNMHIGFSKDKNSFLTLFTVYLENILFINNSTVYINPAKASNDDVSSVLSRIVSTINIAFIIWKLFYYRNIDEIFDTDTNIMKSFFHHVKYEVVIYQLVSDVGNLTKGSNVTYIFDEMKQAINAFASVSYNRKIFAPSDIYNECINKFYNTKNLPKVVDYPAIYIAEKVRFGKSLNEFYRIIISIFNKLNDTKISFKDLKAVRIIDSDKNFLAITIGNVHIDTEIGTQLLKDLTGKGIKADSIAMHGSDSLC